MEKLTTKEDRFAKEMGAYVDAYRALKKVLPDLSLWGGSDMDTISEYMSKIGRLGGLKRVSKGIGKLPADQRHAMAQKAAAARWAK
jgi:hypothetical protein